MKAWIFFSLAFICVNASPHLLGAKECTWGPSYWCSNLTAAAGCHAVKHCIQTVWEHQTVPEDTDSVCNTCLSMVKQARDQLESNETQEEIKEVFDGSCKLIPIKIVNQECMKLADEFIPELVDTLASQMNPQVVCSVAGLCNNVAIDKLLEAQNNELVAKRSNSPHIDSCTGCHKVVGMLETKFHKMDRDHFLQSLLHVCGRMSSLSDACSNIIVTYFTEIYNHMQNNFNSNAVCLMSGECSAMFHVHEVEITPLSGVGVVPVNGDDLPCDMCKQLVGHLRDLLVANTTEDEFQKVLQGLCKQTNSFKDECLSIVNEYYPVIYKFLVSQLNSTAMCDMIGICPAPNKKELEAITPLLPVASAKAAIKLMSHTNKPVFQAPELMQLPIERLTPGYTTPLYNKQLCTFCEYFLHYAQQAITNPKTEKQIKDIVDKACSALPSSITDTCVEFVNTYGDAMVALLAQEIDPSTICPLVQVCPSKDSSDVEVFMQQSPEDKPNCPMCLFAVTELKEMVKNKQSEANIEKALQSLCSHLSGNMAEECQDFVNTYTKELIEMLVNDFAPQEVCVYLKLCKDNKPAPKLDEFVDVEPKAIVGGDIETNEIPDFTANGMIVKKPIEGNKPQCIICEFIMEKVDSAIEDKHTEEEIENAIHGICNDLPKSVRPQCNDFVNKYADAVLQLIIATANPKEICTMMKLCEDKSTEIVPVVMPQNNKSPQCMICKLVLTQIETLLAGSITEKDVTNALNAVCSILPKAQENACDDFVDKNGEMIVKMIVMAVQPSEICSLMMLCKEKQVNAKLEIHRCGVCQLTVMAIDKVLQNPNVDHSIEHVLEKACRALPTREYAMCTGIIEEYGVTLFHYITHMGANTNMVCKELGLCGSVASFRERREVLLGSNQCTWGPGYWCVSTKNAEKCGTTSHCEEKVWKGKYPSA